MTGRIEHALVMDTDDIPGRGGYAVVGLSDGVTAAERVFVAANFGISDFLHDPRNERAFYSFCRVPGGRYAFIRRFPSGKRRNETQNRVFVHTLFLDDRQFEALQGLPWLLIESKFRSTPGQPYQPLTTDGDRLAAAGFLPLEREGEAKGLSEISGRLRARAERVGKLLQVEPAPAIAKVVSALQRGERALLPQGTAYELLTLLAWSSLPLADRAELAWTQHDSMNVGVAFSLANVPAGETVDVAGAPNPDALRLVEMNLESDQRRSDLHQDAARYKVRIRGERLHRWLDWCDRIAAVRENLDEPEGKLFTALQDLATSADASAGEPWAEGQQVLQLLWPNIQRAIDAEQAPDVVVKRWASLLERSGLGARIFRETPSREWLDRIAAGVGAQLLTFFFVFSTENDARARQARGALTRRLLEHRDEKPDGFILSRLAVRLGDDRSAWTEPLIEWLLEAKDGLTSLHAATPLTPMYGDLVLLATLVAIRTKHKETAAYVRNALVPHLELSAETLAHVSDELADAVARYLRDQPEFYLRFFQLLPRERQGRLLAKAGDWIEHERDAALPLARTLVKRASNGSLPRSREGDTLVFALMAAGDEPPHWIDALLVIATSAEPRWFETALGKVDPSRIELQPVYDAVVRKLHPGSGPSMRALVLFTRSVWTANVMKVLTAQLGGTSRIREWEPVVVAAVKRFGSKAGSEAGRLLGAFWSHVEPMQVRTLTADLIDLTQRTGGAWRSHFVKQWTPRLRQLPASPQTERLIALLHDSPEVRFELLWRAFDLRNATLAMINRAHDDLAGDDAYEEKMGKVVDRWADMMPAHNATPLERAQRMLELAGEPGAKFAIREIAAARVDAVLAPLQARDWAALVKLPVTRLSREGSTWMTFTRLLGAASGAEEAARDLETICLREKLYDGRDAIRAGRGDAAGVVARTWKRARIALGQG
jgi:hypothetical protein